MKTAEEYIEEHPYVDAFLSSAQGYEVLIRFMVDFGKLCTTEALKAAAEKGLIRIQNKEEDYTEKVLTTYAGSIVTVDKNSILNAYPLENIK